MNPIIPEPAANASIIDWAKPVTRALTALTDKRGAAARNERDRALPKLRPWEIHFFPAQTQEDEDFWGVYLPAGSLNVAGEEVTPTDETGAALADAGAAYPGYYVIPVASGTSPSAFWLHVYTSEGTGGTSYRATVGASATANAGSGEETLTSIRLCSIAASGAITQLIVGAIALGGGGGASGTITYIKAIRYDAYTQQIQAIAETCDLATGQTTALQVLPNPVNGWIMISGGQAERAPICECNTGSGDSSSGTGSGS
jgi:hypothetical protein